jgi:DNA polymerase-3 subunit gamma/tau
MISALHNNNPRELLAIVAGIATYTTDFYRILEDLTQGLHDVALAQFVPEDQDPACLALAQALSKESVQLYYQIALIGMRDLTLSSNPRAGLEMTLLRMLAFQQITAEYTPAIPSTIIKKQEVTQKTVRSTPVNVINNWTNLLDQLQLTGMAQVLASHCSVETHDDKEIVLLLSEKHKPILSKKLEDRIKAALCAYLGKEISLVIKTGHPVSTPAASLEAEKKVALQNAADAIANDAHVQTLMNVFDAQLQQGSTKALETTSKT